MVTRWLFSLDGMSRFSGRRANVFQSSNSIDECFFFCGKWKFFKNYPLRDSATVGCFTGEVFITTSLLVFEGRVQCDFDFNDSNKKGEFEGIISIKMNRNVKFA